MADRLQTPGRAAYRSMASFNCRWRSTNSVEGSYPCRKKTKGYVLGWWFRKTSSPRYRRVSMSKTATSKHDVGAAPPSRRSDSTQHADVSSSLLNFRKWNLTMAESNGANAFRLPPDWIRVCLHIAAIGREIACRSLASRRIVHFNTTTDRFVSVRFSQRLEMLERVDFGIDRPLVREKSAHVHSNSPRLLSARKSKPAPGPTSACRIPRQNSSMAGCIRASVLIYCNFALDN
jgi:hypothetical protein